jgi:hypothetical protein
MRFMMLVKSDARTEAGVLPDEALLAAIGKYNGELMKAGVMLGGEGLHPSSHGVRLRITGEKTSVLDGPFAEAEEVVAGYWLIHVASKAEAIEWARRYLKIRVDGTGIRHGEIEVRQVFDLDDFPVDQRERTRRLAQTATGVPRTQRPVTRTPRG